jgi:hypothetical protein
MPEAQNLVFGKEINIINVLAKPFVIETLPAPKSQLPTPDHYTLQRHKTCAISQFSERHKRTFTHFIRILGGLWK